MFTELYALKIDFKRFDRPDWMKLNRVSYEDIKDVSIEEFERIENEFRETEKRNNAARRHNDDLYKQAEAAFFEDLNGIGIQVKGVRGGILQPFKNTIREIRYKLVGNSIPAMPSPNLYLGEKEYRASGSLSTRLKALKLAGEREAKAAEKNDKLLVASIAYLSKHDPDGEWKEKGAEAIINRAWALASNAFVEEKYPDGTEVDVDDNICECESWTVGERRCSCGNRRMYLEIEGDLLNGFWAYPNAG